jgi:hypothetical protein
MAHNAIPARSFVRIWNEVSWSRRGRARCFLPNRLESRPLEISNCPINGAFRTLAGHLYDKARLHRQMPISALPTIREVSVNATASGRIYAFGWQGGSATMVNMKVRSRGQYRLWALRLSANQAIKVATKKIVDSAAIFTPSIYKHTNHPWTIDLDLDRIHHRADS